MLMDEVCTTRRSTPGAERTAYSDEATFLNNSLLLPPPNGTPDAKVAVDLVCEHLAMGLVRAGWADKPAKLAQKDRDARWTVKWSKAKPADDGSPRIDLAVPRVLVKKRMARPVRKGFVQAQLISLRQRIRPLGRAPAKMEIRAPWSS